MNRISKAILRHAADNLAQRAQNARESIGRFSAESAKHDEGAAYAFTVASDYLHDLVDGHAKLPSLTELGAAALREERLCWRCKARRRDVRKFSIECEGGDCPNGPNARPA